MNLRSYSLLCCGFPLANILLRLLIIFLIARASFHHGPYPSKVVHAQSTQLVISQIYGGGGNSGATLQSDFIEIKNISTAPLDVNGMTVQYASANGSLWQVTPLGTHLVPAGGYLLIKQASGSSGSDSGTALEFPDVVGDIKMAMGSGKVALVANVDSIEGMADPDVVDFVGYGSANEAEGGAAGDALSSNSALQRFNSNRSNGICDDTDNNAVDFEKIAPEPRNSSSPKIPCPMTTSVDVPTATPESTITFPPTTEAPDSPTIVPILTEQPTVASTAEPTIAATELSEPTWTATTEAALLTAIPTQEPTSTRVELPTEIPQIDPPVIATPEVTATLTATNTVVELPTDLPTAIPTMLSTVIPTASNTVEPTYTATSVNSPTNITLPTSTSLFTSTTVLTTPTETPTVILTSLPTMIAPTATVRPEGIATRPIVGSSTPTATRIALFSPTSTSTSTSISTMPPTVTPSGIDRSTPGPTEAPTESTKAVEAEPLLNPIPSTFTPTLVMSPTLMPTTASPVENSPFTSVSPPQLSITEVMMNPSAVKDNQGEFIELFNPNNSAVDLLGWRLSDGGSDSHTITESIVIPPGGYAILARNGDVTTNGGVVADYVYSSIQLGNSADELILTAADGTQSDYVLWDQQMSVAIPSGASLERSILGDPTSWVAATVLWIGSAGDLGSPGAGNYQLAEENRPTSTSVPVATISTPVAVITHPPGESNSTVSTPGQIRYELTPTAIANQSFAATPVSTLDFQSPPSTQVVTNIGPLTAIEPTHGPATALLPPTSNPASILEPTIEPAVAIPVTATPTGVWLVPTAVHNAPGPAAEPLPTELPMLIFSEVMVNPSAAEDKFGEYIELYLGSGQAVNLRGYKIADLDGESHIIANDLWIQPNGLALLARSGIPSENGGFEADYIYFGISLANSGDELLLLAPNGIDSASNSTEWTELDRLVWSDELELNPSAGASLERSALTTIGEWVTASRQWPGSLGDKGSPGRAYVSLAVAGSGEEFVTEDDAVNFSEIGGSEHDETVSQTTVAGDMATQASYLPIFYSDHNAVIAAAATLEASLSIGLDATTMPTASPQATSTPTSTPTDRANNGLTSTPQTHIAAQLFISEIMANPKASADSDGEYIEICNSGTFAMNLQSWALADLGDDYYTIESALWAPAGSCIVLGRNADPAKNGGLSVQHVYAGINLSNSADEVILIAPNGIEVDRVEWNPQGELVLSAGASLQRVANSSLPQWFTALDPWPGSAGDAGSPGWMSTLSPSSAHQQENSPPIQTATATVSLTATQMGSSSSTEPLTNNLGQAAPGDSNGAVSEQPSSLYESTINGAVELLEEVEQIEVPNLGKSISASEMLANPPLWIAEFMADPADVSDLSGEWIRIYNPGMQAANLRGWILADTGNDFHVIDADIIVDHGADVLLARSPKVDENEEIVVAYVYDGINLANGSDEILLLTPNNRLVDKVTWGKGTALQIESGVSIKREMWKTADGDTQIGDESVLMNDVQIEVSSVVDGLDLLLSAQVPGQNTSPIDSADHEVNQWDQSMDMEQVNVGQVAKGASDKDLSNLVSAWIAPSSQSKFHGSGTPPKSYDTKEAAKLSNLSLVDYVDNLAQRRAASAEKYLIADRASVSIMASQFSAPSTISNHGIREKMTVGKVAPRQSAMTESKENLRRIFDSEMTIFDSLVEINSDQRRLACGVVGLYQGKTVLLWDTKHCSLSQIDTIIASQTEKDDVNRAHSLYVGSPEWYVIFFVLISLAMTVFNGLLIRNVFHMASQQKDVSNHKPRFLDR